MKINEILESDNLEPSEAREFFMEIAKEIDMLLSNPPKDLSIIDSNINFLKQWSNSCINDYTSQQLLDNPDVAFICEVGEKVVASLQNRRDKL
jgi:hypothetical protein